jgi:hypothetical protein
MNPDDPNGVPPHFHKTDRIEAKDLIPNGATTSVVPDYPAPEGTEVLYLNGSDFRIYRMVDGTWRYVTPLPASIPQILASVTLGSAATSLASGTITAKKFLRFEIYIPTASAAICPGLQFNGDTGNNYAWRVFNNNLGSETAAVSLAQLRDSNTSTLPFFFTGDMINIAGDYKSLNGLSKENNGAASVRAFVVWDTWANNTNQVTSVSLLANNGANNLPAGTIMNIYGHD